MKLYHVSPAENDALIRVHGLLIAKSQTARLEVWACPRDKVQWAVAHCRNRHDVGRVTIWVVKTRARQFRKWTNGLYRSEIDVLPEQLLGKLILTGTDEINA